MDNDGIGPGGTRSGPDHRVNTNCAVYSSFTTRGGNNVFWHSDRKCFLVGKKITDEFLSGLVVPE